VKTTAEPCPGERTRGGSRQTLRVRVLSRLASPRTRVGLMLLCMFLSWFSWSMGRALTAPGGDSIAARVAEWARDHHLGPAVTLLEQATYTPPKIGGSPSIPVNDSTTPMSANPRAQATRIPPLLASPAGPALPGEGAWGVLATVHGSPAIFGTRLRPDAVHTSYLAGIVSMDQRLTRFELHPGAQEPGAGHWRTPTWIPPRSRTGLLATFNGGFKLNASGGGFYLNGAAKGALTSSAASLVFYRDGHVAVGAWGRDVSMTDAVVGVRQNLRLIVDQGSIPASVDKNVQGGWGFTLGGAYHVWRSGVGVTTDGRLVFVYGPALSVHSLANLLKEADCIEAMQLDINPAWMSYMYYTPSPDPANPTPVKFLAGQQRPADRYYSPSSRDFTAVYTR
jgi:hypothetical protein